MSMRVRRIGIFVVGFAFLGTAATGETFAEVSKKIATASKKQKLFSAKTKMVMEIKQEGFSMLSTTEGTHEMLRKGDEFLTRVESVSVRETTYGGNTTKQESSSLMIVDGSYSYTVSESAGTKTAYKTKREKSDQDPFKVWRETAELKVLPDTSLDGHAVWVIEATPKKSHSAERKIVMYYHKQSGQMIKMVAYTPDGTPLVECYS